MTNSSHAAARTRRCSAFRSAPTSTDRDLPRERSDSIPGRSGREWAASEVAAFLRRRASPHARGFAGPEGPRQAVRGYGAGGADLLRLVHLVQGWTRGAHRVEKLGILAP